MCSCAWEALLPWPAESQRPWALPCEGKPSVLHCLPLHASHQGAEVPGCGPSGKAEAVCMEDLDDLGSGNHWKRNSKTASATAEMKTSRHLFENHKQKGKRCQWLLFLWFGLAVFFSFLLVSGELSLGLGEQESLKLRQRLWPGRPASLDGRDSGYRRTGLYRGDAFRSPKPRRQKW